MLNATCARWCGCKVSSCRPIAHQTPWSRRIMKPSKMLARNWQQRGLLKLDKIPIGLDNIRFLQLIFFEKQATRHIEMKSVFYSDDLFLMVFFCEFVLFGRAGFIWQPLVPTATATDPSLLAPASHTSVSWCARRRHWRCLRTTPTRRPSLDTEGARDR